MVTQTLTDKLKEKISWLPGFVDMQRASPIGKRDFQLTFKPRYWCWTSPTETEFTLTQEATKGLAMVSDFMKEVAQGCYNPKPAESNETSYDKFPYSVSNGKFCLPYGDSSFWLDYSGRSGNIYFPSIGLSYSDKRVPQMSYLASDKGVKLVGELNKFGKSLPKYLEMSCWGDISLRGEVRAENIKESASLVRNLRSILQDVPCREK